MKKAVLVVGVPGSGKTTVHKKLIELGYESHNSDNEFARWEDKNGDLARKDDSGDRKWEKQHSWNIDFAKVQKSIDQSKNKTWFMCGTGGNIWQNLDYFDQIVILDLPWSILEQRLDSRKKEYGKHDFQKKLIKKWLKDGRKDWKKAGAYEVSSDQPIEKVVEDILQICKAL